MKSKVQRAAVIVLIGMSFGTTPVLGQGMAGMGSGPAPTGTGAGTAPSPTGTGTVIIDPVPAPTSVPYDVLDNIEGDRVTIMNPPVNPMVLDDTTLEMWVIDNHNNEIHLFNDITGTSKATWGVPSGPVSLAMWEDTTVAGGDRLLVVCRNSWVVCMLDRTTGDILGVLQMRDPSTGEALGEPADILVDDQTNQAFVSCSAADAVVEIDLNAWTITNVFRLPSKNPVFLSFDVNGDVLVAPELSGNNTIVHRGEATLAVPFNDQAKELGIMDLNDPALAVSGLNDYDLFRIVRSGASIGTVQPVASSVGTILFGHCVNPVTGDIWMLNTDANNQKPAQQTEAALNGDFASNRLSLVTAQSGQVVKPHTIIDLDVFGTDAMGNPIYDGTRSMAQPFNLDCTSTGYTFVVGMLSDNVTLYDPNGNFVLEWDLPKGAIPRDVVYSTSLNTAFVYCWGTNEVLGYLLTTPVGAPWIPCDLGEDPLPADLKRGREILFSAEFSADNRFSCLTCHVDGHSDVIAWPLGATTDDKGPMLTQSLTGIETVHPFHWRGERKGKGNQLMVDFNGAFTGLLGSPKKLDVTPGGDWDKFEDFVFSLQQPANPRQNKKRVIQGAHQPPLLPGSPVSDSVQGQADYAACVICHTFPKGTANDFAADGAVFGELNPHRVDFKVAPFTALWRRYQDADPLIPDVQFETVDFVDSIPNLPNTDQFPPLGGAISHAGLFGSLQHFILLFLLPAQTASNLTGFIDQWDSGIAPVSYRAWYVDQSAPNSVFNEIVNYLVPQCTLPTTTGSGQSFLNGDFAVIGSFFWQGAEIPMRWYWDPKQQLLIPEDSTVTPQQVGVLLTQARNGQSSNTFIGLPVGSARRFAVDKDGDDLFNIDELNQPNGGSDPEVVDSDGDGFWDGHEVANGSIPTDPMSIPVDTTRPRFVGDKVSVIWKTAKIAVVQFATTEQTTATILYKSTTGDVGKAVSSHFARRHRIVLSDLDPSDALNASVYDGIVKIEDHAGLDNQPRKFLPTFTTDGFIGQTDRVKIDDIGFQIAPAFPTDSMTVRVQAVQRVNNSTPIGLSGYQVVASISLDDSLPVALNTMGGPQSFTVLGQPYTDLPGPFVLSTGLTDVNGFADLSFSVPSAVAGQKLTVVIQAIQRPGMMWTSTAPDFDVMSDWSFPATPKDLRTLSITL